MSAADAQDDVAIRVILGTADSEQMRANSFAGRLEWSAIASEAAVAAGNTDNRGGTKSTQGENRWAGETGDGKVSPGIKQDQQIKPKGI
ncbi:unnamed protein product [Lampetra planeri]